MKKNVFVILAAVFFLFSCSNNEEFEINSEINSKNSTRLAYGQNVKLIKAKDFKRSGCSRGGCSASQFREFVVEVANLAFAKKVIIREQLSNGSWEDFELTYDFTTSYGTEIWKGTVSKSAVYSSVVASPFGEKFAVKYEVNGTEYWDNNNGSDYVLRNSNRRENSEFLLLSDDISVFRTSTFDAQLYTDGTISYVNVAADVKNIAFNKTVQVVYTTDNWATKNVKNLFYNASFYNHDNPNYETWTISFQIPKTSEIKYAFVYKVNGVEYWDNNFGSNYTVKSSN